MKNRFPRVRQIIGNSPSGVPQVDKLHKCHIYVEDLSWSHAGFLDVASDFVGSYELSLVVSVTFLVMSSTYLFPTLSSARLAKLSLTFPWRSLHLYPSVTEWRLLNESWGSHQSDHRRWPVQVMHPTLLGVLTTVILIESCDFPLHQVST